MITNKQTFIYCDLNKLRQEADYPLSNQVIITELINAYGKLGNGMRVWLYSDTFNKGKFDPMIFPGVIHTSERKNEYSIEIERGKMEFLSASEEYKDYTIQDVIGLESFNEIISKHPEWF